MIRDMLDLSIILCSIRHIHLFDVTVDRAIGEREEKCLVDARVMLWDAVHLSKAE